MVSERVGILFLTNMAMSTLLKAMAGVRKLRSGPPSCF
jgi:hypothetical protein